MEVLIEAAGRGEAVDAPWIFFRNLARLPLPLRIRTPGGRSPPVTHNLLET